MLGQVFHINATEIAQTCVQRDERLFDAHDLHTLHQFAREVESCDRHGDSTLMTCKDVLETLVVFLLSRTVHTDIIWNRCLAKTIEGLFEHIVGTIIEETECTSTRRGVVNHLCHQRLIRTEVELVAYTNLAGRVNQHIPQTELFIEFTKEKHLNARTRLLLVAVKTCREHSSVVEDKGITLLEIIGDLLEDAMFYLASLFVYNHELSLITVVELRFGIVSARIESYLLVWESELKL